MVQNENRREMHSNNRPHVQADVFAKSMQTKYPCLFLEKISMQHTYCENLNMIRKYNFCCLFINYDYFLPNKPHMHYLLSACCVHCSKLYSAKVHFHIFHTVNTFHALVYSNFFEQSV